MDQQAGGNKTTGPDQKASSSVIQISHESASLEASNSQLHIDEQKRLPEKIFRKPFAKGGN
jgi:hypothetical protein